MMKYLVLLITAVSLSGCDKYPHLETLEANREGGKLLQGQNAQGALDHFLTGLRFNPFQPELHLNLGLSFEVLQQNEKAMASYKEAERLSLATQNYQVLFMSLFNQAQLLGKDKKVDEAIAMYQKALELIPSSKEVKTNIELLTQQQGQGDGDGESKDKKEDQKDSKDQKQKADQQKKDGDGKDQKDDPNKGDKDKEDKEKDKDGEDKKEQQPKQVQGSPKYKPRPFNGKELTEGDVKKILGELKQQEEKIRAEFNRKEVKEQPRDKDW